MVSEMYARILNAPTERPFEPSDPGWSMGIRHPLFPAESLIKLCLRADDSQRAIRELADSNKLLNG